MLIIREDWEKKDLREREIFLLKKVFPPLKSILFETTTKSGRTYMDKESVRL